MINFDNSQQCTLSIRLRPDGFSFSIYNPLEKDSLTMVEKEVDKSISLTANLKKAIQEEQLVNHQFKKVNFIIANSRFTTCPFELFQDDKVEKIFYHNFQKKNNEVVLYNILNNNCAVLFGMDETAYLFLKEQFSNAHFYAQTSPLIDFFGLKSSMRNNKKMYAFIENNYINIYAFNKRNMLVANSFNCNKTNDYVYHILYLWKQLELDQEHDELHLAGQLFKKDVLTRRLKKYIMQLFIMNPINNIDIQALLLCE